MKQKKILLFVLITGFIFTALGAYNPPPNGENMYELVSPQMVSSGSSVTGGGLKTVTPESIALNPSLIAGEQRWVLDLSYTGIIGTNILAGYGQTANVAQAIERGRVEQRDARVQGGQHQALALLLRRRRAIRSPPACADRLWTT